MTSSSKSIFAYAVPQNPVELTSCGRLDLNDPTPQSYRVRNCFVAYVVLRGELYLVDYLPDGPEQFSMRSGDIHIIAPGLYQASTAPSKPGTRMIWIHFAFSGEMQPRYLAKREDTATLLYTSRSGGPPAWVIPRHMPLAGEFDNILRLYAEMNEYVRMYGYNDLGGHQICGHLITALHHAFAQQTLQAEAATGSSLQQAHVARAKDFIRVNFDKKISLAETAAAVGLTPAYLSRCFQQATGQSVVDFLLHTRIQAAKQLLAEQAMPSVKEVAFQTGFSSPIYFCRIFRRLEKRTALEFAASVRTGDKQGRKPPN